MNAYWPEGTMDFDVPFTLGHENAGWVEALGARVEGSPIGAPWRRSSATAPCPLRTRSTR